MIKSFTTEKTMKIQKPKVIAIVGPTASGKTSYAIKLAQECGGEIISADSRLVYKGFDTACAKPTLEERHGIPHYMIDVVTPDTEYSGGLYAEEARKLIADILNRGKVPIVAGGTGLYIRLLLENYIMPKVEPDWNLRETLNNLPAEDLYQKLQSLDDEGAQMINANDKKKIIRAIEIVRATGKQLSEVRGVDDNSEFDVQWIGRNYPRDVLYKRINDRVEMMIEQGIVEETQQLLKKYGRIPNLIYTIGYQEIIAYLDGSLTFGEAIEKLKQNTRRYAKRQLTWFRQNPSICWNCYPEPLKK